MFRLTWPMILTNAMKKVIGTASAQGFYDNSVLIVASDNGGCPYSGGYNSPLRGAKQYLFEVRAARARLSRAATQSVQQDRHHFRFLSDISTLRLADLSTCRRADVPTSHLANVQTCRLNYHVDCRNLAVAT